MSKGNLIHINASNKAPELFWREVLLKDVTAYGVALVKKGDIVWQAINKSPNLETLKKLDEVYKDQDLLIYLHKEPFNSVEDLQPFKLLERENGTPAAVAFLVGDYSAHKQPDMARCAEYYVVEGTIVPLFQQFIDLTDGDITKTVKLLGNKLNADTILNTCQGPGTVVILSCDGTVSNFDKIPNSLIEDWGYAADACGYKEGVYPDQPGPGSSETDALKALMDGGSGDTPPASKTVIKDNVLRLPDKGEKVSDPKDSTAVISAVTPKVIDLTKLNNKAVKALFQKYFGHLPGGWHKQKTLTIPTEQPALKDLAQIGEALSQKNVMPSVIKAEQTLPARSEVREETPSLPIIPVQQRIDFKKNFLTSKVILAAKEKNPNPIPTPEQLKEMEDKLPTFSHQTGVDIAETFTWSHDDLMRLGKEYPETLAVLCQNFRLGYMKGYKAADKEISTSIVKSKIKIA